MQNPPVKVALCNCGKARAILSPQDCGSGEVLSIAGFEIKDMPLSEARKLGMCFEGLHNDNSVLCRWIYDRIDTASNEQLQRIKTVLMGYPGR